MHRHDRPVRTPTRQRDGLYLPATSPLHRLTAAPKLLAALGFLMVVVATGPARWPAFVGYAVLLLAVTALSRLPARTIAWRMLIETPVVVFAALLPLVAAGPRQEFGPLTLSTAGLVGGAVLLAKATLGTLTAVLLASTTRSQDLLTGLRTLRVPATLVAIAGFMVRYAAVLADDLRRMRVARASRAFAGGNLAHARLAAAGIGLLFVRSYERGERVHHAMLARGYTGTLPTPSHARGRAGDWGLATTLPGCALAVLLLTRITG